MIKTENKTFLQMTKISLSFMEPVL